MGENTKYFLEFLMTFSLLKTLLTYKNSFTLTGNPEDDETPPNAPTPAHKTEDYCEQLCSPQ